MTVWGYARVSTASQSLERQERNISKIYPDVVMVSEAWTGTQMNRPTWDRLMKKVKSGDVIIFDSVSRMSRTADEGIKVYIELMSKGVSLVFLKEPHISTETYKRALETATLPHVATGEKSTDTLISGIFSAIEEYVRTLAGQQIKIAFEQSEKEVMDLRQRTKEGLETARQHGKVLGRPVGSGHSVVTKKEQEMVPKIRKMSREFEGSMSDKEVMETLRLARNTYYRYKKKLKEDQ